jgi:hypothetical protein
MTRQAEGKKRALAYGVAMLAAMAALGGLWSAPSIAQTRAAIVKNVDEPGRTPWTTRSQILPNAGGCFGSSDCFNYSDGSTFAVWDLRPVPAGKRWVVQSATGSFSGGESRTISIEFGSPRGGIVYDGIRWTHGGPFFPGTLGTTFTAPVFAVFNPGEVPYVRVSGKPSLGGYSVIVFNGYLIDAT